MSVRLIGYPQFDGTKQEGRHARHSMIFLVALATLMCLGLSTPASAQGAIEPPREWAPELFIVAHGGGSWGPPSFSPQTGYIYAQGRGHVGRAKRVQGACVMHPVVWVDSPLSNEEIPF